MNLVGTKKLMNEGSVRSVCVAAVFFGFLYLGCYSIGLVFGYIPPLLVFAVFLLQLLYLFSFKIFFTKYIWLLLMMVWLVLANTLLVASPIWLNELQLQTYENGSLLPLAVAISAMLQFILLLEIAFVRNRSRIDFDDAKLSSGKITLIKALGVIALLIAALAFIFVATTPSWVVARDRFDYAANFLPSILRSFQGLLILIIPLAAPCLKVGLKKVFYGTVAFYILYLIWIGEKFTSLFLLFYILILVLAIPKLESLNPEKVKRLFKKIAIIFCVAIICFLILVFTQYIRQFGGIDPAINVLEQRIASQAEVWWGVYGQVQVLGGPRFDEIGDELGALRLFSSSTADPYEGGIWKLMRLIMTPDYYQMYISNSTRLTSSTPATFYYYFGFFGLLGGMMCLGFLYFLLINTAVSAFERVRILEGIFAVYLIRIMHGILTMSDFGDLFYWRTLVTVFFLLGAVSLRLFTVKEKKESRGLSSALGDKGSL